jgi:hypothetical protein
MYRCIHFVHERFHANENYSLKLMVVGHRWTQMNTDSPSTGLRIWPRITRICTKRMDTDGPSTPAWCGQVRSGFGHELHEYARREWTQTALRLPLGAGQVRSGFGHELHEYARREWTQTALRLPLGADRFAQDLATNFTNMHEENGHKQPFDSRLVRDRFAQDLATNSLLSPSSIHNN